MATTTLFMIFCSMALLLPGAMGLLAKNPIIRTALMRTRATECRGGSKASDPLLLRACRGEVVERTPVWMMRQAGRHMKEYRDLCINHKSFRERSENADLATEISLQPWRAYGTDGIILFSDILTPLPGMGIDFDILEGSGPKLTQTWTTAEAIDKIKPLDPAKAVPYVGETLRNLRAAAGNSATVLGFVGLPYTLASYMIEGGSSKDFLKTKQFSYQEPALMHRMLEKLAKNIAAYVIYQIENGAQVVQLFDSWAGNLSPQDYDDFAGPYLRMVVDIVKKKYPNVPLILYINKAGALLERMATSGADVVSLDWTVTIPEARKRMGNKIGIQGNLDPMLLFAPKDVLKRETEKILRDAGGRGHVMNLGHGIDKHTSEESVKYFVDTVKNYRNN
jgi:uroporphyrinogen decarboxylase